MFASRQRRPARIALGLFFVTALVACGGSSGPKPRASVRFALGSSGANLASAMAPGAPAAALAEAPAAVVLSISTESGEVVNDLLRLPVYAFGPTWVSQQVELEVGSYRLTQFLVVDAQNRTIYAAPNSADPNVDRTLLAQVQRPLPLPFEVGVGVVHSQAVEVLPVGGHTPQQFGYAAFTFRISSAFAKSANRVNYGPGPDGIFMTPDDEVVGYNHVEMFDNGTTRTDRWYGLYANDGRGPDQTWFTADDIPSGWWWERGQGQWGSTQGGPGADGLWVSDDDAVTGWERFGVVVNGNTASSALYSNPGPDGVWFTDDDVQTGSYKMTVNEYGGNVRQVRYSGPGADGIWYTDDDEVGQDWFGAYVVNTYSGANNIWNSWDRQVRYNDAGPDGIWFTDDDTANLCVAHEFGDGTQYWTREVLTVPGYGQPCFGPDDFVVGYSLATNTY